jgi:2-(1,2-epoxy-1,2-dihydrophenyl)acetyl-CoA isomerase
MTDDVLFDKRPDGIGLITLNRPDSLNAMGGMLVPMLGDLLRRCEADREVRCVVLPGNGRGFCAGGDVRGMKRRNDGHAATATATEAESNPVARLMASLERNTEALRDWHDATSLRLHTMAKPTVALVNGVAVGAGFSVALACDIRICSDRARFGTAFRNVGLSGDFGGSYFLQRIIGAGRAREMYFTAEIIDAQRALELGIANRVVPHDDLLTEGLAFCAKLASGPTGTFGRMKRNLNLAETGTLDAVLDQEALLMRMSGMTADSREAVRAFMEKREPNFTGE